MCNTFDRRKYHVAQYDRRRLPKMKRATAFKAMTKWQHTINTKRTFVAVTVSISVCLRVIRCPFKSKECTR